MPLPPATGPRAAGGAFANLAQRFGRPPRQPRRPARVPPGEAGPVNTPPASPHPRKRRRTGARGGTGQGRFPGTTEAEVMAKGLPDYLGPGLDVVFCGINPGLNSAYKGHHYGHGGNHFWRCLHESGFTPRLLTPEEDAECLELGFGLTNVVHRTTRGSADLSREEVRQGARRFAERMAGLSPRVICFNGKGIYEVFRGGKCELGLQPQRLGGARVFVLPSSSPRVSAFPRYTDKLPFYRALHQLVQDLKAGGPKARRDEGEKDAE